MNSDELSKKIQNIRLSCQLDSPIEYYPYTSAYRDDSTTAKEIQNAIEMSNNFLESDGNAMSCFVDTEYDDGEPFLDDTCLSVNLSKNDATDYFVNFERQ